ncbi:MAG: iron-containing redox enzyme family protein [Chloroflexi bacterium]|nr:iron-containing redox enzyme family protein [Chloroflexota bacterium]
MAIESLNLTAFRDQLEEARRPTHGATHPWSQAWADGRLSLRQMAEWAKQHHYYIDVVAQNFAALFARCDDLASRQFILDNLVGEELEGERHPALLLRFAIACGMSREEVLDADRNGEILPATRGLRSWVTELAYQRPIAEAGAGIMVGLEGQLPKMYPLYVERCKALGLTDDDLMFFTVHITGDVGHNENGLRLVEHFATTPALQRAAIGAVRASGQMRKAYLDAVYEHFGPR